MSADKSGWFDLLDALACRVFEAWERLPLPVRIVTALPMVLLCLVLLACSNPWRDL